MEEHDKIKALIGDFREEFLTEMGVIKGELISHNSNGKHIADIVERNEIKLNEVIKDTRLNTEFRLKIKGLGFISGIMGIIAIVYGIFQKR